MTARNGIDTAFGNSAVGIINYMSPNPQATGRHPSLRQGGEFIKNTQKSSKKALTNLESHEMVMHDARLVVDRLRLDHQGFQVAAFRTKLPETLEVLFEDGEIQIREIYWPEIVDLARRDIRSNGRVPKYVFALGTQKFTEDKSRGLLGSYSRQAHADFSDAVFDGAWKMMTKRGVPEHEAKHLDLMFVNAWRPFGRIANDNPLAILDWTSIDPSHVRGPRRGSVIEKDTIYSSLVSYSPSHRWYYLPNMTPEEVWFFKQADSRHTDPDISKHAFHTAVKLNGKEDRGRRSIAVRLVLGFEPSSNSAL